MIEVGIKHLISGQTPIVGDADRLAARDALVAMIGQRFHPVGEVPENPEFPYVTYQRISTKEFSDVAGGSRTQKGRFQLDCWTQSYLGAMQLADLFRRTLSGYRGDMGDFTNVSAVRDDQFADYEPPQSGQAKGEFRRIEQYFIFWNEVN